jgi:hypothetical protein
LIAEEAISERPNFILPICIAAASAALTDKADVAQTMLTQLDKLEPGFSASNLKNVFSYLRAEDFEKWTIGLRKAGLPE